MPLEAPSNCWTTVEAKIAEGVANSAAFQSLTGTASALAAASFVFGEELKEPLNKSQFTRVELNELRHYAQVYSAPDAPYGLVLTNTSLPIAYGTAIVYVERLVIAAELAEASGDVPGTIERLFKNRIGNLMAELLAWVPANEGPHIRSINVTDGPGYNSKDRWTTQGVWQGVELTVAWGLVEG